MDHFHPPLPKDEFRDDQTSLTEVTESNLPELRCFRRYFVVQKLLRFLYFLLFGVVKLVSALLFALLTAPFFITCCALWWAAGRPE
jgi:hypothetical protein